MLILSSGSLRTGSTVWQTRSGSFVLTVVCKTTYWLAPGEAVIAAEQEAVNEADDHWDDDPNRSVRAPSDLMPTKLRPEVTLVGYAYAANEQPVRSLVARMIIGDVDKSIEIHADRTFLPDGTLHEGPRFTRMRLTWERAGGGPGTSNPVGMRADVRDAYGRRAVPNLQPTDTYFSSRDEFFAPVGFGPIASTWPSRAELLGRAAAPAGEGLEGHTAAYYNAAPADQRLTVLRENERIVLENLHPKYQRLVTNLPGYRPAMFVERAHGTVTRVTANADSLWIDTDRGIATLTWRALIPLAQKEGPGRVLVTLEPPGREFTWNDIIRLLANESSNDDDEVVIDTITTSASLIHAAAAVLPFVARPDVTSTSPPRDVSRLPQNTDLPFQAARSATNLPAVSPTPWPTLQAPPAPLQPKTPPAPTTSLPTNSRASLPGTLVTQTSGAPPPPVPVAPAQIPTPVVAPPLPPPPVRPSAVSLSEVNQPPVVAPPLPPPPVRPSAVSLSEVNTPSLDKPRAPTSPWAGGAASGTLAQPQTIGTQLVAGAAVAAAAPVADAHRETAEVAPMTTAPSVPPAPPPRAQATRFDAAFGGGKAVPNAASAPRTNPSPNGEAAFSAKAASDAAAARSESAEAPRERASRVDAASDDHATSKRRQAVVNLLCFDAQCIPRVRRNKRFTNALVSKNRLRRAQGLDEVVKDGPPDDRSDILRVLSCAQPADTPEIRRALAECLDDLDDLEPPMLLVAGEMRPLFDEIEMLRTTIAVAQQVAGGDKKVLATIAVGQEAAAASIPPRPETTLGFIRQIEQAALSLNLPTRYVPAEVERILTEGRKYKRRTILGAPRIRADLTFRNGDVMSMYLPDSAASSLPLLISFPVIAICEVTPREDLTETQDEALVVLALGRVLRTR